MTSLLRSISRIGDEMVRRFAAPRHVHAAHYDHVLGTSLDLRLIATTRPAALDAEAELLAEVDRLEQVLSAWSTSSEFSHWQSTHGADVPVSSDLAQVLEMSDVWRLRTGGAFDPAAQAVIVGLAGDDDARVADVLRAVALHEPRWTIDHDKGTARRLTELPLSIDAIAKGFIVVSAARRARAVPGVSDVLLNIGGDVQHLGDDEVRVGVSDPMNAMENATPVAVVQMSNAALATSGGYRRGFVARGQRVSHIVDPRTGTPASRVASASAIAPDCAAADALSTAFAVLPPHESVALANSLADIGCMLIEDDGRITTNASWDARALPAHNATTDRK